MGAYINTDNKAGITDGLDILYESSKLKEQGRTESEMFANSGNINSSSHSSSKNDNKQLTVNNILSFGNGKLMGNLISRLVYRDLNTRRSTYDSTYQTRPISIESESFANKTHALSLSSSFTLAHDLPWGDLLAVTIGGNYHNSKPDKEVWLWQNRQDEDSTRNYANDYRGHSYAYSADIRYHYNPTREWQITPYFKFSHSYNEKYNQHYLWLTP